jgi:IS30 family transposase
MSYSHLSVSERFKLYHHRMTNYLTMDVIAIKLNRVKSTISRELKRNSLEG